LQDCAEVLFLADWSQKWSRKVASGPPVVTVTTQCR